MLACYQINIVKGYPMNKRKSLADALATAAYPSTATAKEPDETATTELAPAPQPNKKTIPPAREGKKAIVGYFDPSVSRQLREIALAEGKTLQGILREALNDFFAKRGKSTIA